MKFIVVFIFMFLAVLNYTLSDITDFMKPKTIRLYQFRGKCPHYENAPIYLKDIHITLTNRIYYISLKRVAKVNVTDNIKLELTLIRCQGRESSDSCETYQTINVNHLCDLLNAEGKPWSPFVKNSDPPMGCPIRAGVITVKNGTFDGGALSHLPVSGWIWKVTAKVRNERTEDVLLCLFLEGQITPV